VAAARTRLAKLTRPSAQGLLRRPRLFAMLDAQRKGRCLWLAAPAGAGKTSLISGWVAALALGCVWYQADPGDADPATFFHYLRLGAPGRRKDGELPHLTPEYLPGLDVFTRRFFEAFFARFDKPFALVLDNVQDVPAAAPFHPIVGGALHVLPPDGLLVCISREAPAPALARWQADAGFRSLGWDELRFTDEEARELARQAGEVDGERVAALNGRVRGWAAGLRLLLRAGGNDGQPHFPPQEAPQALFDYIASEVFDRTPDAFQDFMLRTAVLTRIDPGVARELSGHPQAAQTLDWLHRRRLFTELRPQPGSKAAYEYHPLMREFLLDRAQKRFGAEQFQALQARAGSLVESAGEIDAAAALWIGAQDWPALTRLICRHAPALLAEGRIATVEEWILAVPDSVRATAPWLLYWLGSCQGFRDPVLARTNLESAYGRFKAAGETTAMYLALAGILLGFFNQWGELRSLDRWIGEFDEQLAGTGGELPSAAEIPMLNACLAIMMRRPDHPMLPRFAGRAQSLMRGVQDANQLFALASFALMFLIWSGDLSKAREVCSDLVPKAMSGGAPLARSQIGLWAGCVMWQEAEHDAAVAALNEAIALGRRSGMNVLDSTLHIHLAYTALSAMDADAADRVLDATLPLLRPERAIDIQNYHSLRAGALLARGRLADAIPKARQSLDAVRATGAPFGEATYRIQLGQMLMLDGQHREAREHFAWTLDFAQRMLPSDLLKFQALVGLAYSRLDAGEDDAGLATLREALGVGSRQNYMNCHPLWIPKVMSRLCARALEAGIEVEYVRRLIRKRGLIPPDDCLDLPDWPFRLRVHTLGRFAVVIEGEALRSSAKAQKKPLDLLKALIALGGRGVSIRTIAADLWPDLEGDAAENAFHLALHRLRKLLGDEEALVLQDGRLSVDARRLWVDAWAFERLAGRAGSVAGNGSDVETPAIASLAARLLRSYPGHFLGEEDAAWAIAPRERLRSKYLRAVASLGGALETARHFDEAADLYRRALEMDALAEGFYLGLMRCLGALDRRAEALATYRRASEVFSVVLGVQPSAEMQAAYRALQA
jgi:DNA-binding SARP family transcriptional activator